MKCPYCDKPMTQYGQDSFYRLFRCKNRVCWGFGGEHMELLSAKERASARSDACIAMYELRMFRGSGRIR